MSLAWKMLEHKKLVKAANAVAKLDMGSHLWARPLKLALAGAIPHMPGRLLANLKAIAVMELLDEPVAMQGYLERCLQTRGDHLYTRHLQMVELHVHLVYPELWESLGEPVRLFLQEARTATERSRDVGAVSNSRGTSSSNNHTGNAEEGTDSETDTESDTESESSWRESQARTQAVDKRVFSSACHQDVSRILGSVLGVTHHNRLHAGPMSVDICHVPSLTVIEVAPPWQYYLRSAQVTALARRRHELLRAMGFKLVYVPYHRWGALEDDIDKGKFLRKLLPGDMLSQSSVASEMYPAPPPIL